MNEEPRLEKEVSTSTLVQILILEATDSELLYPWTWTVPSDAAGKVASLMGTLALGRLWLHIYCHHV